LAKPVNELVVDSFRNLHSKLQEIDAKYSDSKPRRTVKNPYPTLKGVACVPCTKNHLSTIAGALSEAVRFARSEGTSSEEVTRRIGIVEDELNIWERVDATPDKIEGLNPQRARSTDLRVTKTLITIKVGERENLEPEVFLQILSARKRMPKAMELIDKVKHLEGGMFEVPSQSSKEIYVVDLLGGSCTCADWQFRGQQCKHQLAARLARDRLETVEKSIRLDIYAS